MSKYYIDTIMDMSTAHVTREDMEILGCDGTDMPFVAYNYEFGAIIPTAVMYNCTAVGDMQKYGYSESFIKAMQFAIKHGVRYLNLDCDGHIIDTNELDKHDW